MRPAISLATLPGKLPSLLTHYGQNIVAITPINGLLGGTPDLHGATFCLNLADGSRLKARYWPRNAHLAFQMNVIKRLPSERFPAILASTDQATLEQWIDGEIIGDSLTDRTVLPACGELLGVIHNTTPPDSVPESVSSSLQEYERWLIEGLAHLTAIESIDAEFARRVEHAALASKPNSAAVGLIHRDFCGDNLVISERLVRSIDNTSFAVGPFDADLARTWYRWPMAVELWDAFLEGYGQQRDSSSFREYGNFWKASVLIRAALMRIRSGLIDQALIPLGRLRELFP